MQYLGKWGVLHLRMLLSNYYGNKSSAVAEMGDRLATIDMGPYA